MSIFVHEYVWLVFVLALFLTMMIFQEVGHVWGKRRLALDPHGTRAGAAAVEGAVFALLGLLVAFSFAGAASRFEHRRDLIVDEANAVGTAYLRVNLLPGNYQIEMHQLFRNYLSTRLAAYDVLPDIKAAYAKYAEAEKIQGEIWTKAVTGCREDPMPACSMNLLPALNTMFDIANTRRWVTQMHPPALIFLMLFFISVVCALMAGFAMAKGKSRNWVYSIGFATVIAVTVYVILDLEYPRLGFLRVDKFDDALVQVLQGMK